MAMCLPMSICCLLCVIWMVCIEGMVRRRYFQRTDVGALHEKAAFIIDDIYAETTTACALHCTQNNCVDFLFRKQDTEIPDDHCYISPHTKYMGHLNTTASGLTCQRWDSDVPHNHWFDTNLLPDSTVEEAQNYCRDVNHHGRLWNRPTDPNVIWEYCNIVECMATAHNCRLYSIASTPNGPWNGYSYFQG